MRTQEDKDNAQRFWQHVEKMKKKKFPSTSWGIICEKAGINFNTLRSAKCYGSLPNDKAIDAIARVFEVPRNELLNGKEGEEDKTSMNTNNTPEEIVDLTTRRQNVALKVFSLNKSSFYAVERLMGLSPNIEFKKTEVDIYEN